MKRSAYYAPDPWAVQRPGGGAVFYVYAKERLQLVKLVDDRSWLKDMAKCPTAQKSVRTAISRRLRGLG